MQAVNHLKIELEDLKKKQKNEQKINEFLIDNLRATIAN